MIAELIVSEQELREKIAKDLEALAWDAIKSNEYNFNDTAVRAKMFIFAADFIRGKNV